MLCLCYLDWWIILFIDRFPLLTSLFFEEFTDSLRDKKTSPGRFGRPFRIFLDFTKAYLWVRSCDIGD